MSPIRTGETMIGGRVIPEAEVVREGEGDVSFQVREAVTVRLGPRGLRGRRERTAGEDARPTPRQSFQVREAVTVTVSPPHWAKLTKQEEPEHVHHSGPDTNSGEAGSS